MAIREPWRMAIAHLTDAGLEERSSSRAPSTDARIVRSMLDKNLNCPSTSSVGRLFDAVASIAGVRDRVGYEGQAAVELEWLAAGASPDGIYPFEIADSSPLIVDTRPLIRAVARDAANGTGPDVMARRFHSTLVEIIAEVCVRLRQAEGFNDVVLTGGVFLNALLTVETTATLTELGFRVYRHRQVPPNDGGLSLGQLAVAAARRAAVEN